MKVYFPCETPAFLSVTGKITAMQNFLCNIDVICGYRAVSCGLSGRSLDEVIENLTQRYLDFVNHYKEKGFNVNVAAGLSAVEPSKVISGSSL